MRVKILDRFWGFRWVPNLGSDRGQCDAPSKPGKELRIWMGIKDDEELLEVLVHEFLHAADWSKDEEFVDQFGKDLARFLTRMGYVRKTDV